MEKVKTRSAKRVTNPSKLAAVKATVGKIAEKAAPARSSKSLISAEELQQRIQNKAYDLYLSRGCSDGNSSDNWYEAERIVKAELGL